MARVRRELGVPEGKTAVLYAPTHRDWASEPPRCARGLRSRSA
ncbi:CDP-glycerol glycerophosphotransferase family protein [Streptomyces tendae]